MRSSHQCGRKRTSVFQIGVAASYRKAASAAAAIPLRRFSARAAEAERNPAEKDCVRMALVTEVGTLVMRNGRTGLAEGLESFDRTVVDGLLYG